MFRISSSSVCKDSEIFMWQNNCGISCLKWHVKVIISDVFIFVQCILGNFKYSSGHNPELFCFIANSTLKEYEIITLIYNGKTCKLDSLHFIVSEDIIFSSFQPCITKFRQNSYMNSKQKFIEKVGRQLGIFLKNLVSLKFIFKILSVRTTQC